MPQGLFNTSSTPLTGPDSMLALMGNQAQNPGNPQRRSLQDFIHPVDRHTIADIQAALAQGLDPQTATSLLSGIGSGISGRYDTYQANRQEAKSQATDALMQLAQTNPNPAAAQTYTDAWSGLHPNMPTGGLERLAGNLYPGGDSSPLYADPNAAGPAGPPALMPEDIATLVSDAQRAAAPGVDPQTQQPLAPVSLHQLRMLQMASLRAQGYSEADLARAYDVLGKAYMSAGGTPDAPITSADRLAAMSAPQAPPAPAPAPAPGSGESLWDKIKYATPGFGY